MEHFIRQEANSIHSDVSGDPCMSEYLDNFIAIYPSCNILITFWYSIYYKTVPTVYFLLYKLFSIYLYLYCMVSFGEIWCWIDMCSLK